MNERKKKQVSSSAKEVSSLRRDELLQRISELQNENKCLRLEIEQLRQQAQDAERSHRSDGSLLLKERHGDGPRAFDSPTVTARRDKYSISFSVMVIENGKAISVPLSSVIDKSYIRPDLREADTPVVAGSLLYDDYESLARLSMDSPPAERDYSQSATVASMTANDGGGRPSISFDLFCGDDTNEPMPTDPETPFSPQRQQRRQTRQEQQQQQRNIRQGLRQLSLGRVLNKRAASLDSDAVVTHGTLRSFYQKIQDGCGIVSPLSSYGNAIYHYIVKNFALRNGCRHSPSDIEGFGRTLCSLCGEVKRLLQSEPRHGSLASPCYVFGDLHGNFWDLFYFLDNIISFQDLRYTPHRFLFLGDYVDRGDFSVEVVAYLFAIKVLAPEKVLLLRGNHEDTLVNGDITGYGSTSFRAQCQSVFGTALGDELWHRASETFAYLPLTANIDGRIFCTHGGIPRYSGGVDDRLEILCRDDFPVFESFFHVPDEEPEHERLCRQMAIDTCWADPADDESKLDEWGFGANSRGSGVIVFGSTAVDDFLEHYNFEYIFRAHQEKSDGLRLSKNARVFTIFSTSAYVGHENGAGAVLVADGKIRLIIKNADDAAQEGEESVANEEEEEEESGKTENTTNHHVAS